MHCGGEKVTARSDFEVTSYANSITLTPGTVTVDVDGDMLLVHALTRTGADPASFEMMNYLSAQTGDPSGAGKG